MQIIVKVRIHIREKDLRAKIHSQGSDSDSCFYRGNRSVHYPDYRRVYAIPPSGGGRVEKVPKKENGEVE